MRTLVAIALLAGCHGPSAPDDLYYAWDDRRVLCSEPIDDETGVTRNWDTEEGRFRDAEKHKWVTLVHAHVPEIEILPPTATSNKLIPTVSMAALERVFGWADQYHLDYVRFDELVPGTPRAGLAFAFDDESVDEWFALRPFFAQHHAKVTFFVTRWQTLSDAQIAELEQLAAEGHDLEPHTVHHLDAAQYVAENGLPAYMNDEVMPSFDVMTGAGLPKATSFAYPFGLHSDEIDDALLQHVDRVRTTPGECPGADSSEASPED